MDFNLSDIFTFTIYNFTLCLSIRNCFSPIRQIQEIFVNPSPFRSRQKVTDVKSDGLSRQENFFKLKYTFVYAVFTTANVYCNRFLALFDTTNTFFAFRSINTIDNTVILLNFFLSMLALLRPFLQGRSYLLNGSKNIY